MSRRVRALAGDPAARRVAVGIPDGDFPDRRVARLGVVVGFSDRWLLVPSAIASVATFVIAFSLQHAQNRDMRAIQLKLDEILRATARHELVKAEHLPDDDLTRIEEELIRARDEAMPPEPGVECPGRGIRSSFRQVESSQRTTPSREIVRMAPRLR